MSVSVLVRINEPATGAGNIVGQILDHGFADDTNSQQAERDLVEGNFVEPLHIGHSLILACGKVCQRKEAEK